MSGSEERGSGSPLSRFYSALGFVAMLGVAIVAFNVATALRRSAASGPIDMNLDDPEALVAMARGVTKGDAAARVTIVEFGDYQCPSCGHFARNVEPQPPRPTSRRSRESSKR